MSSTISSSMETNILVDWTQKLEWAIYAYAGWKTESYDELTSSVIAASFSDLVMIDMGIWNYLDRLQTCVAKVTWRLWWSALLQWHGIGTSILFLVILTSRDHKINLQILLFRWTTQAGKNTSRWCSYTFKLLLSASQYKHRFRHTKKCYYVRRKYWIQHTWLLHRLGNISCGVYLKTRNSLFQERSSQKEVLFFVRHFFHFFDVAADIILRWYVWNSES